jgi:hypothetical protein
MNALYVLTLYSFKINFNIVLHFLYCADDKIEKNEMAGHVARMGEGRGVYRVLVGKPERKRPLRRPRRRWEDNIKMDHQEVECVAWTVSIWLMTGTGGGYL